MNALWQLDGVAWWHVAGWTMLHYLWMGAIVGVAALVSRVALRRASANVRYATALACLAALAVLPVGIGIGVGQRIGVRDQVSGVGGIDEDIASTKQPVAEVTRPSAPGSARGEVELNRESRPVENVLANEPQSIIRPTTNSNPRQSRGLTAEYGWQTVVDYCAVYLPWVWIVGAPLTFLLLTTGVVGGERLRRQSRILRDGPVADAAARIAESLQIGRRVTIAVCERIAAPVLVGIVRPMILLPPAALTGWSPDEIKMVLLHELAHVRRWDNFVNLVQRMVEAALFFQPAVWLVSNWVRREREACCDAVVVGCTNRPHAYAELLVALASQLPRSVLFHPAASSAMAAGPLRGRIRRILGIEDDPLLISGKSLGVVMSGLLLAATLVVLSVTTSTQAEEEDLTTESTEGTERNTDSSDAVPDIATLFVVSDNNPLTTVRYTVSPKRWNRVQETLESVESSPLAKHFPFEFVLDSENSNVEIRTAKAAQRGYFKGFFNAFNQGLIGPHPRSGSYADWYLALAVEPVPAAWLANHEGFTTESTATAENKSANTPPPVEVDSVNDFFHELLPFTVGASRFANGDNITITEVVGPTKHFAKGGTYWIKGTYTLATRERASLAANVTARSTTEGVGFASDDQSQIVHRGSGTFELKLTMPYEGWPHVSFYPSNGGESFGGVYFGTGDSVLKKWWRAREFTTEGTASTEKKIDIAKQRAATQNNLKNLALALLNFEATYKHFPAQATLDADGKPQLSWRVMILPFLGEDEAKLFAEFRSDESWDGEHNRKLIARMPKVFRNPQIDKPGMTNYLAVVGEECVFDGSGQGIRLARIFDGTSRTIAIVEADADRAVEWTKPADWEFDRERPTAGLGGMWPYGWFAAWVDGSVRSVSNKEKPDHVGIQFTRGGGEMERLAESAGRIGGETGKGMEGGMGRGMGMGGAMMGGGGVEFGMEGGIAADERGMMGRYGAMGMGRGGEDGMGGRGGEMGMAGGEFGGEMEMGAASATGVPAKKFPSLEEQKLADVVYRRLGLELEPLTTDELRRVKALGFEGGMKVSLNDGSVISWERNRAGIVPNDILVGLHVWPTKSAADVVAVLERNDLADLNPLKYYAVRPGEPSGGGFGPGRPEPDTVGTGRITVTYPATKLRLSAPSSVPRQSTASGASATDTQLAPGMKEVREERIDPKTGQTQTIITVHPESQPTSPEAKPALPPALYRPGIEPVDVSSLPIPTDVKQALRERGPLTVALFYGENSAPCREMRKILQEFERTHLSLPVRFDAKSVEMDRPVAIRYGIERVPTLVWLRDDEVLSQSVGALSLAEFGNQLFAVARALPEKQAVAPKLLYDGKSFEQWRSAWKTELSTEKRLEAVKALAAFGANGNGKEAAEAILEVVEQLDWSSIDDSSAGRLKQACVDALTTGRTTGGYRVKSSDWLPLLVNQLTKGSPTIRSFSMYVISQLPVGDRDAIQPLLALSQQKDYRAIAFSGLKAIDPQLENSDVRARFRQALSQPTEDPVTLVGVIGCLLYHGEPISGGMGPTPKLRYFPELGQLLFHDNREVRQTARMAISFIQPEDAGALVKQLLSVINDETRNSDRIEAIRALAAIGNESLLAEDSLIQIAQSENDPERYAAAMALVAAWDDNPDTLGFEWGSNFYERLFGGDYMKKIDYDTFQNGMIAEEKENFAKNARQRFLGGGGGFF